MCNTYALPSGAGFIQTPGWQDGKEYTSLVDSCVTLHVPDDHVTMISLVSLDLQQASGDACGAADYLEISEGNPLCNGWNPLRLCKTTDLLPTVFHTPALSLRFRSDHQFQKTGFRLLYSFHMVSKEPQKLPNSDQWNCSVSYYHHFQQHFACSSQVFCSDKQDKVTACVSVCLSVSSSRPVCLCLSLCRFLSVYLPFCLCLYFLSYSLSRSSEFDVYS